MMLWEVHVDLDYVTGPHSANLGANLVRELWHLRCWPDKSPIFQEFSGHPQCRIRSVDEARLCGPSLPIGPIANPPWVGVDQRRNPAMTLLGIEPRPPGPQSVAL